MQNVEQTKSLGTQTTVGQAVAEIDRREKLSYREYIEEYVKPNKPVLVTDAIEHWTALERWTPDFFRTHYRGMDLDMGGLKMEELIDQIECSTPEVENRHYLRNKSIQRSFPELKSDISPLPIYLTPNWFDNPLVPKRISQHRTDLFIGGRGSKFPYLHFDNYHGYAFIFQIYGEKEFVLIPPEQTSFVYAQDSGKGIENVSSVTDIENPDLKKFPLFANASPARCVIAKGDMLFVPAGWWHTARMNVASITVSSNTANAYNWHSLMADHWQLRRYRPLKAMAGVPYLRLIWLWESFCDHLYRNRKLYDQRGRN